MLFTPRGRLDCVSRISLRRTGLLEPLTCLRANLRYGRSLPNLQEVVLERTYSGLLANYTRLHWAAYLLNLWLEAFPGEIDRNDAYRLLRLSLDSLDAGFQSEWLVSWSELQSLRLLGCAPQLVSCVNCGGDKDLPWFSVESGGALCQQCRRPGVHSLSASTRAWLIFLQRASLSRLVGARPEIHTVEDARQLLRYLILAMYPRLARFAGGEE